MEKYGYRFSFGPWNIHEGDDPFGPPVRPARDFESKLTVYEELDWLILNCLMGRLEKQK